MKKFIKITTREGEAYIKNWIDVDAVLQLVQNSITQEGKNEGIIVFQDGTTKDIISFNETIDSLNK